MNSIKFILLYLILLSSLIAQDYDPFINDLINNTNLDSLISYVRILSGEDSVKIGDSTVLIEHRIDWFGNDLAADYLKNKLESFVLDTYDQMS